MNRPYRSSSGTFRTSPVSSVSVHPIFHYWRGTYGVTVCVKVESTSQSTAAGTCSCAVIAKFHYTGPTGPDQTKSADFVGDPDLRPGSREKVRAGPVWRV